MVQLLQVIDALESKTIWSIGFKILFSPSPFFFFPASFSATKQIVKKSNSGSIYLNRSQDSQQTIPTAENERHNIW